MKNKIYNSLNAIFPDDLQKQKMLHNIMQSKEKIGGKIFTLAMISLCLIFSILVNFQQEKTVSLEPRVIQFSNDEIIYYHQQCYELSKINGIHLGKKIGTYQDYEVYKLDDKNIALVRENVQKIYRVCERN